MLNPFTHRKVLRKGVSGTGTIVAMSDRSPGASSQNVAMTLQIRVEGMSPYEVEDQWPVSAGQTLGLGMELPVKVDRDKPQRVAIDWDAARDRHDAESAARRAALAAEGPVGGSGPPPVLDPLGGDSVFGGALGTPSGIANPVEPSIEPSDDPAAGDDDVVARLERLDALRQSGALSREEFDEQKKKLLG
jgi:putative oligomerization/nucleic acid binding protein